MSNPLSVLFSTTGTRSDTITPMSLAMSLPETVDPPYVFEIGLSVHTPTSPLMSLPPTFTPRVATAKTPSATSFMVLFSMLSPSDPTVITPACPSKVFPVTLFEKSRPPSSSLTIMTPSVALISLPSTPRFELPRPTTPRGAVTVLPDTDTRFVDVAPSATTPTPTSVTVLPEIETLSVSDRSPPTSTPTDSVGDVPVTVLSEIVMLPRVLDGQATTPSSASIVLSEMVSPLVSVAVSTNTPTPPPFRSLPETVPPPVGATTTFASSGSDGATSADVAPGSMSGGATRVPLNEMMFFASEVPTVFAGDSTSTPPSPLP